MNEVTPRAADTSSDFYEALGRPWTALEKAAFVWRVPAVVVIENGGGDGDH